jgi:hypothetical protein
MRFRHHRETRTVRTEESQGDGKEERAGQWLGRIIHDGSSRNC